MFLCNLSGVATSVLRMRLLHEVAFSKKLPWLAQTKVITSKTKAHAVNARWKRLSQLSLSGECTTEISINDFRSIRRLLSPPWASIRRTHFCWGVNKFWWLLVSYYSRINLINTKIISINRINSWNSPTFLFFNTNLIMKSISMNNVTIFVSFQKISDISRGGRSAKCHFSCFLEHLITK